MTAPVAPIAPAAPVAPVAPVAAPAPVAPVAPVAPISSGPYGVDDAMELIARESIAKTMQEMAPDEQPRGADGKFVPKAPVAAAPDGTTPAAPVPAVPGVPVPAPAETPAEEEGFIELPEGYAVVPQVSRPLLTTFRVLDAEGELQVPDLSIEFKANGKLRREPLDKVVKMAEWGVYNQEREQATNAARAQSEEVVARNAQLMQVIQELQQDRDRMLADDAVFLAARAQYDEARTPAARAARAEQQMQQMHQQQQQQQWDAVGVQFFNGELAPAVETITKALPGVSDEEIGAKLLLVSQRYAVQTPTGSRIPPNAYPAIRQALLHEVVPWAQQLNDHRQQERQSVAATATQAASAQVAAAEAATRTAQVSAQRAKNLTSRVIRPGTRTTAAQSPSTREPKPSTPIRTIDDAEAAALRDTMAAVLGTG